MKVMATGEQRRPAKDLIEPLVELEDARKVFLAAGEFLGYLLEQDGFRWFKSRSSLERRSGGRTECIRLESSHWNRTGKLIEFSVTALDVFDEGLKAWRQSNPDVTLERPDSMAGILCGTSFLEISREATAIITRPLERVAVLDGLCQHVKQVALPWFQCSEDPENLVAAVPDALLRPTGFSQDLLEFLVSRGFLEEARFLIRRVLSLGDSHREAFAEGRHLALGGTRPRWHSSQALGWSGEVLGLL